MIRKVLIVGTGTLGSQIGFQCALHGFMTTMYDIDATAIEAAKRQHAQLGQTIRADLGFDDARIAAAHDRLSYQTDLGAAARDADLVSESVPEDPKLKRQVFAQLNEICPARTIFTTNSSTLLPSEIAGATGRPERFLALHFANQIWLRNIAEVMRHPATDPAVFERVIRFARDIGMVPIRIEKEHNGYVLNALLVPMLGAALTLAANDIAIPSDVDRTWMIATKAPAGPFGILDLIGLRTAAAITRYWGGKLNDAQALKNARFLEERYIARGKLGTSTGEGFYTYPNPAYLRPDFLSP